MKRWYDGYYFKGTGAVYNPNSVMQAVDNDDFDSYWTETSAAEGLIEFVSKDYNHLTKTIADRDHYLQWEELPAGEGYADIVYLPKHDSEWPALVIELKWNKTAEGATDQILRKKYPDALKNLGCPILLVGINYEKDAPAGQKKHTCMISSVSE